MRIIIAVWEHACLAVHLSREFPCGSRVMASNDVICLS